MSDKTDVLPPEIIRTIATYLDAKSASRMAEVCKKWQGAVQKVADDKQRVKIVKEAMADFVKLVKEHLIKVKGMPQIAGPIPPNHLLVKQAKRLVDILMENNLKITKMYNEQKKIVSKDLWDSNAGKQLIEAGQMLIALRKELANRHLI
jgi:hypothetical protein